MKLSRLKSLTVLIAGLAVALAAGCGQEEPAEQGLVEDLSELMPAEPDVPESAEAAPEHTRIIYADEYVAVTAVSLAPGEEVPPHPGDERVLYARTAGLLEVGPADARLELELEPGLVVVLEPGSYAFDNVGETAIEGIVIARTELALPEMVEQPRTEPAPAGRLLFESDRLRVRELDLEPAVGYELGPVPLRVVYAPETVVLEYADAEGNTVDVETERFGVHVRRDVDRTVVNTGAEPSQVVVFEFFR